MLIYHLTILAESLLINWSGLTVRCLTSAQNQGNRGGVEVGRLALYVPSSSSNPLGTTFLPWYEPNCVSHPLQIHMLKSYPLPQSLECDSGWRLGPCEVTS